MRFPKENVQNAQAKQAKVADSDPRLQVLLREQQGVTPGGMATVSETVSKPASLSQFAGTVQHSLKLAKTRVLLRGQKRTGLPRTVNQL